jgi:maltooligosyltrehalose synthase
MTTTDHRGRRKCGQGCPSGADMKFVEHTGKAIEAGAKSLSDLEDQMIQAGAELLVKQPGHRTATESANDAEANKCDLQRIVEDFEDSLDQALQMMADYAKLGKAATSRCSRTSARPRSPMPPHSSSSRWSRAG